MILSLEIDDSAKSELMQNVALQKGWTEQSDEEVGDKLLQEFSELITVLARQGQITRRDRAEREKMNAPLAKMTRTVK